jgi:uncharacterized membrane protein YbhN (UPF0104 family)
VALAFVVHAVPIRDRCDGKGPCEPGLLTTMAGARVGTVAALLVVYFVATVVWAARWRALLGLARVPLGLGETWRITLESQAGGIVLPGGIGGDALRVGFVVGKGGALPTVLSSVLLDRVIGLVTVSGMAAALAAGTATAGSTPQLLLVLGSIPVAFVLGLVVLRWRAVREMPLLARGPLARVAGPVLGYLGDPGAPVAVLKGLGWSLLVSVAHLASIRGLVFALGGTPREELWVYLGTTMSFIVSAIPAVPGAWGTGDAAFLYFFTTKAGLAPSVALGVSMVYRLFWYASGGVGAVLYLLRSHASPPGGESARTADRSTPRA